MLLGFVLGIFVGKILGPYYEGVEAQRTFFTLVCGAFGVMAVPCIVVGFLEGPRSEKPVYDDLE